MNVDVFLGLGSNMGEREALLDKACNEIERLIGPITGRSAFIETEPWGFQSANRFLNGVVRCTTDLAPLQLLNTTQHIERLLGKRPCHATRRTASAPTFHDRPIDIDILFYGLQVIDMPRLRVPHPLMLQRDFVMTPLRQLLVQPGDERYTDLLARLFP